MTISDRQRPLKADPKIIEAVAQWLYDEAPFLDQQSDLDGMSVGQPFTVSWKTIVECHESTARQYREDAARLLAAIESSDEGWCFV